MSAILFDLDGTLIDSAPDLRLAVNKLLADFGRPELDINTTISMIGDGAAKLVERAFDHTGGQPAALSLQALTEKFLGYYDGHESDTSKPFPGAIEALTTLKASGYRLGLCTNKPQRPTEAMLKAFGLDHFFDAVIGGDLLPGIKKPDGRHLQAAMDKLDTQKHQTLMVGDGDNDLFAAQNAGIKAIIVSFGYHKRPPQTMGADAVIDDFSELSETINKLLNNR